MEYDREDDEQVSPRLFYETKWFSEQMLQKIQKRAYHGSIYQHDTENLVKFLKAELEELEDAIDFKTKDDIIDECTDVANYAMFIALGAKDAIKHWVEQSNNRKQY